MKRERSRSPTCGLSSEPWKRGTPQVSSYGRVRFGASGLAAWPFTKDDGYCVFGTAFGEIKVHTLVNTLFNGPKPFKGLTTDHHDRNRSNNYFTNLSWKSNSEQRLNQTITSLPRRTTPTANAEGETWKRVGMTNAYVSSEGRFKDAHTKRVWAPKPTKGGYCFVTIAGKKVGIHRLVCEAFNGTRPSEKHTADHKNRIRTDNRAVNLKWSDKFEQVQNRQVTARRSKSMPIYAQRVGTTEWQHFVSAREASRVLKGFTQSAISECVRGKRKVAGTVEKYRFKRASEDQDVLYGEVWRDVVMSEWTEGGAYYHCLGK